VCAVIAVPSNSELLGLWERGRFQHPVDRALTMLGAFTGRGHRELAALSIAQRDVLLTAARVMLFGSSLVAAVVCSACGAEIEVSIAVGDVPESGERGDGSFEYDGRMHVVRAPDSFDVAAILGCADLSEARLELARRCIGVREAAEDLIDAVDAALARTCAFAELDCCSVCPACGSEIAATLDIGPYLWTELAWQAERLFDDVALLAARFGWSEEAVLRLSDERRQRYVQVAG
jgi:hypothetical protein